VSRALATFLAALVLVCLNTACSRDEAAGRDTASQTRDSKSTPSAPPAAAAQQTHAGMNMPEHGTANLRTPNPTDPGSRPSTGSGRPEALEGRIPDPGSRLPKAPSKSEPAGISAQALTDRIDRFLESRGYRTPADREGHPGSESIPAGADETADGPVPFVCEEDVRTAMKAGRKLMIDEKTIITPSARDLGEAQKLFVQAGWPR